MLSLQRELDLEGSGGSKNHTFQVFFRALISNTFFRLSVFDMLCFFVILVDALGSVWRPSGKPKGEIKAPFSPDAPRRVPGKDSGPIFGGFRRYLGYIFASVFNDFLVVF